MLVVLRSFAAFVLAFFLSLSAVQAQEDVAAPVSVPEPSAAKKRYDEGLAAYAEHRFAEAIAAFAEAYALEERAEILFAWAQATRLAGQCDEAEALFQKFLLTHPPVAQVEAAEIAMKRCEPAKTPVPIAVSPTVPVVVLPPPVVKEATPVQSSAIARHRDGLGGALVSVGVFSAVAGAALLLSAHENADPGQAPESYQSYYDRYRSAQSRSRWGVGLLIGGGAMLLAGGARFASLVWYDSGAGVKVGGRF
jgi:tetratricopeptide (TPR) repeat protein